jgi:hypothetical protein
LAVTLILLANQSNAVEMRQEFNTFKKMIEKLLNSDSPQQDETGAYMYQVYHVLRGDESDDEKKYVHTFNTFLRMPFNSS